MVSESALNLAWVLLGGFLVMFMQAGFAMVETGFTRTRNAAHTMAMNFVIYPVGVLGFWLVGYGADDGGGRRVGHPGRLGGARRRGGDHHRRPKLRALRRSQVRAALGVRSIRPTWRCSCSQMVFMDTAATIPTGTMAERWRFSAFGSTGCSCRRCSTRFTATGSGAAAGFPRWA